MMRLQETASSARHEATVAEIMTAIGRSARAAAPLLELASTDQKNRALRAAAAVLRARGTRSWRRTSGTCEGAGRAVPAAPCSTG